MILVFLGVSVFLIVLGLILFSNDCEMSGGFSCGFGVLGVIIFLIVTICLTINVSNLKVIDNKIEMYQEENTKIEEQIAETVKEYQQYETDILTEVTPDCSITLVALYPELKSDTLVQKQIEVYIANNEKIKNLKVKKINGSLTKWWLYFGG